MLYTLTDEIRDLVEAQALIAKVLTLSKGRNRYLDPIYELLSEVIKEKLKQDEESNE